MASTSMGPSLLELCEEEVSSIEEVVSVFGWSLPLSDTVF